jgi:hypothetical protein
VRAIRARSARPRRRLVGTPGGATVLPVYFVRKLDLWFAPDTLENRYWNAFGIGDPFSGNTPAPHVEINFPLDGLDRRIAGAFAEDEGAVYVTHSGRVGGGAKGVSRSNFLRFYPATRPIRSGDREIDGYVLGRLGERTLIEQIAEFTDLSRRFREGMKNGAASKGAARSAGGDLIGKLETSLPADHSFSPEREGTTVYDTADQVVAARTHGGVVRALRARLRSLGLQAWNTKSMDLYVARRGGKIAALFEVKSTCDTTSIYTAVGQLIFNGAGVARKLVAVLPAEARPKVLSRLHAVGISTVTFRRVGSMDWVFSGLEEALGRRQ